MVYQGLIWFNMVYQGLLGFRVQGLGFRVCCFVGTEGSIAGDGQLVLKGKYGPKHIEALLRKYISQFKGLGFRVQGLGFVFAFACLHKMHVKNPRTEKAANMSAISPSQNREFRVQGLEFRVQGLEYSMYRVYQAGIGFISVYQGLIRVDYC